MVDAEIADPNTLAKAGRSTPCFPDNLCPMQLRTKAAGSRRVLEMSSNSNETEVVRQLFNELVPDVATGVVEIRGIVREPGNRSILAVVSKDPAIDAVGACVGKRGDRVKQIVAQLGGENVDIVLWNESTERFIANLLTPMHLQKVSFDEASHEATVHIARDSERPLAGRLAMRSKLLLQLTGWNLILEK